MRSRPAAPSPSSPIATATHKVTCATRYVCPGPCPGSTSEPAALGGLAHLAPGSPRPPAPPPEVPASPWRRLTSWNPHAFPRPLLRRGFQNTQCLSSGITRGLAAHEDTSTLQPPSTFTADQCMSVGCLPGCGLRDGGTTLAVPTPVRRPGCCHWPARVLAPHLPQPPPARAPVRPSPQAWAP